MQSVQCMSVYCVSSLGFFMLSPTPSLQQTDHSLFYFLFCCSTFFLADRFLKYTVWNLYDKVCITYNSISITHQSFETRAPHPGQGGG